MNSVPNFPQGEHLGCTAKIFISFLSVIFISSFIITFWSTGNILFVVFAIVNACIGLLQVDAIHNLLFKSIGPFIDKHTSKVIRGIKQGTVKVWKLHNNSILLFIIFGLVIYSFTSVPSMIQQESYESLCTQNQNPLLSFCGDGIGVARIPVDVDMNNRHIMSSMNIGIIDTRNKDQGPFNQYDANNNGVEQGLENKIFEQNQKCPGQAYVSLIVATSLSQTVTDIGLSSNVGLDILRGAYMAQYNFNQNSSQHCLHLLIANFGTKDVAWQTIPTLMKQIKLYAKSYPQNFMGIVGLPFSLSVAATLYSRSNIPGMDDIPIISSSAVANSFAKPNDSASLPNNFYTNFYRIVSPVSSGSKVFVDFMANHSDGYLAPANTKTVLFQDPNDQYTKSLGDAIFADYSGNIKRINYTIGQPHTFKKGIDYILANECKSSQQQPCNPIQIIFAGYGDDLSILKNKLVALQEKKDLTQPTIRIIGGEGLYDLGSYNIGAYANLFFVINASYAWINPASHTDGIPIPSKYQNCSDPRPYYSEPFNCEFRDFFQQVYPANIYGSELAGTNVLLMYDAVQAFLIAWLNSDKDPIIRQVITKHWSNVAFQGVSGKIQFSQYKRLVNEGDDPNNPLNKPRYIACTDSHSHTYIVAKYDMRDDSPLLPPTIREGELKKCLNE
jgi:hypothetical protein